MKLTKSLEYINEKSIQKDEEKLRHEYSSYIAFVLMGNSMSESFNDIEFIQLESFIENNLEKIQNLKINESDLLNSIEVLPEKVIFNELEQKLNNSIDEICVILSDVCEIHYSILSSSFPSRKYNFYFFFLLLTGKKVVKLDANIFIIKS